MKDLQLVGDGAEIYVCFLGIGFALGGLFTYFLLPRLVDLPCNYTCKQAVLDYRATEYLKSKGLLDGSGNAVYTNDPLNIR